MPNLKIIFFVCLWITVPLNHSAQTLNAVIVPEFSDKYSNYVKQLEAGQLDIDYQDFRFSFIESEQFRIAHKMANEFEVLKTEMYDLMSDKDFPAIITITKKMLSIDYTSLIAHKVLRQTYKAMGDTLNSKLYHDIQFGLLRSIISKGDGKTCGTAWPVIQRSEEYFIIETVFNATLLKQSAVTEGGLCDKMEVKKAKKKGIYYFETSKVSLGNKKLRAN